MTFDFSDPGLYAVDEKLAAGERLNFKDGLTIYNSPDLLGVGWLADRQRRSRHGNKAYYVYNQHINYTNVCINHCKFCAFWRSEGEDASFTLTVEDLRKTLLERIHEPISEIHMVGGINPSLPFEYYIDLLKTIRDIRPNVTIKAFTAVEIDHFAALAGLSLKQIIERLKEAGLNMLPGGGAEVMSLRVRQQLFPNKITCRRWLEVMETAHRLGLKSNATMLYGHVETIEERVAHLLRLRGLQDQTRGFSAFIPLSFHPKNTKLSYLSGPTGWDDLKNVAAARLLLDNFEHIKAYWVMIGEKTAQVALSFGADDLDGTVIEEKISHMAGATSAKGLSAGQLEQMICSAGLLPVQRDGFYEPVAAKGTLN
jgi:aminodeoxyfutalosine synthase